MAAESNSIKISVPTILIGAVGFFVSLYALILHLQNLMKPGRGALCDISAQFNCSSVIGSSYGEIASIPLGSYGMTYFIIIISAAILPKISSLTKKQHSILEFIIGLVGFISVVSLFYISHFILKTICPTCSIIHIITIIYFIIKTISVLRNKKVSTLNYNNSDYLIRFIAVCLCFGIPTLATGLIAPIIIDKYFHAPNKTAEKISEKPAVSPISLDTNNTKTDSLSFNKTNYVGNGEDYRRGSDDAKVVVQMFSDFGCPHCKNANVAILQAQDRVGLDKVLFIYRFFPLSNKCNSFVPNEGWPYSCSLAEAARCAGMQGKFWEFKDWVFSGQEWANEKKDQNFSMDGMKNEAKNLGINVDGFSQCIESGVELNKIKDDAALANKLNIKGTPLILINGQKYNRPYTVDDFSRAFQGY